MVDGQSLLTADNDSIYRASIASRRKTARLPSRQSPPTTMDVAKCCQQSTYNRLTVFARWRQCARPFNIRLLGPTPLTVPNGIWIDRVSRFSRIHGCYQRTDRPTDRTDTELDSYQNRPFTLLQSDTTDTAFVYIAPLSPKIRRRFEPG